MLKVWKYYSNKCCGKPASYGKMVRDARYFLTGMSKNFHQNKNSKNSTSNEQDYNIENFSFQWQVF